MEVSPSDKAVGSNKHPLVVDDLSQFQKIVESIASCVYVFQGDKVCYANPYTESLTGYSKDELLAMPFWGFVHQDDQAMIKQRGHARAFDPNTPDQYDFKIVRKNGEVRWVNWRPSMIELNGKAAVLGVGEDITERKQAEERLQSIASLSGRATDACFFRTLVSSVADALHVKVAFVAKMIAGESASAQSLALWIDGEHVDNMQWSLRGTPCEQVAKGEFVFIVEGVQAAFPDDAWLSEVGLDSYVGIPVKDAHGHVVGHIGVMDDKPIRQHQHIEYILNIFSDRVAVELERKHADALVRQSAVILEMIATGKQASSIYDAIASMYESRHPGMRCSLLELKGDRLMHGGAPSLPEAYCQAVNGLKNGQDIGSCGTSTYTGKRVLVEDIATDPKWADLKSVALPFGLRSCWSEPIKNAAGKVLGAFGMYYNHPALPNEEELADLQSAARLAGIVMQKKLKDAWVNKLSQAIEQAGESVVITDKNGVIEYVNPRFTRLTGYSSDEAIGQTPRLLNSGNQDVSFYENMWKTISAGNIWQGKIIDRRKDGSFYPASLTISPIRTGSGSSEHHSHYVGIQSDLTKIEDMEQQFHQAQKMEAIGTLVGGIAHDFNNMLAGMTGNLYLARKKVGGDPDVMQKLANVDELAMRAADMIQQLLTFARKDRVSIKPIPFIPFIKETLKLLRASVPENIAVREDICADALQVTGDSTLLHQVLMNLMTNARDALEAVEHPCITVRLEACYADESFVESRVNFKPGAYARLSVEDNGCGIPKKQLKHLFEPFFTTKEQGKGTGLGLAMVFGAVKTHQGFVEVDSIEGEGSIFHIYLPLLEQSDSDSESSEHKPLAEPGQGETILFADDQQQVLETGKEVLESLGYQVLTATNGQQAVQVFEAHVEDIDLCIFDIIMPVMNGSRAAQQIRQIKPDVKIIFSTGYDKLNQSNMDNETVICKPFPIEEMSRLIRRQLDG